MRETQPAELDPVNWGDLVTVVILGVAGLLVGGVIGLWSTNRFAAGIVAALAVLTAVWGVTRMLGA